MDEIGTRVLIIADCRREGKDAAGQVGIYDGEEPFAGDLTTPRIRLPDGSFIYGCECWWTPADEAASLEEERENLREHVERLRQKILGETPEEVQKWQDA